MQERKPASPRADFSLLHFPFLIFHFVYPRSYIVDDVGRDVAGLGVFFGSAFAFAFDKEMVESRV